MGTKFETKVQELSVDALLNLKQELEHRVETKKIGFGKRALHLIAATATGAVGAAGTVLGTGLATSSDHINESFEALGEFFNGGEYNATAQSGAKILIAAATIGMGTLLTTNYLFNRRSNNAQKDKISFVESELAKREQRDRSPSQITH